MSKMSWHLWDKLQKSCWRSFHYPNHGALRGRTENSRETANSPRESQGASSVDNIRRSS